MLKAQAFAKVVTSMHCPNCGLRPYPSLPIVNSMAQCPHCHYIMLTLPSEPQELDKLLRSREAVGAVSHWFPRNDKTAGLVFLAYLVAMVKEGLKTNGG